MEFKKYFEQIKLDDCEVIIVSLAGTQQMVSALTLCRYIKEKYPYIKIVVGGNPFTKIVNRIDDKWKVLFRKMFDHILVFEGEYVLPEMFRNC